MDSNTAAALMDEFHALIPGLPNAPRHEVFTRLRQELPVFKSEKLGVWVAARYADVIAVTTQDELFQPPQPFLQLAPHPGPRVRVALPGHPRGGSPRGARPFRPLLAYSSQPVPRFRAGEAMACG